LLLFLTLGHAIPAREPSLQAGHQEILNFGVEWRFVRAGEVRFTLNHPSSAEILIRSVGLLNNLCRVNDVYNASFGPGYCAASTHLEAQEGKRRRDTRIVFDTQKKIVSYLEKDLVKNSIVLDKEMDIPACVHDAAGGLQKLRQLNLEPGKSAEIPFSDGKKVVMAKVEALARERVTTSAGEFSCIKYEAFLFNGVVYSRKGRLFLWMSDDNRRVPVQIKIQLPFYVGTITIQLEKT
jgi:hypothetical protein